MPWPELSPPCSRRSSRVAGGSRRTAQDAAGRCSTSAITQGIDSMNPLRRRRRSPAFEAWNMQYATLTDKAAKDFSVIPGLAESWKGSADGKTWTYKLRDGPEVVRRQAADVRGHRLHGQPLAQGGVAQPLGRRQRTSPPTAPDPQTVVIKTLGARPQASDDGHLHPPEAHLGEDERRGGDDKYDGEDGVGSGPFVLDEVRAGPVRAASRPTPTTGAASRPSTRS